MLHSIPIKIFFSKYTIKQGHLYLCFKYFFFCYRVKVLECSAKDDINIKEIFRSFLTLSKLNLASNSDESGLKRRSSAYVSASKGSRRTKSPTERTVTDQTIAESSHTLQEPRSKPRSRSLIRRSSRKAKQQIRDAQADDCTVS